MNEDLFHGLHHISMIASSVHTLEFYEKLGFREVHAIKDSHQHLIVMKGHGLTLEFLIDEDHPYAFVTLIERGGFGITAAGPVAGEVMQWAVENIEP